jgi:hypothetical protein
MEVLEGEIAIETSAGLLTLMVVEEVTEAEVAEVAVMETVPCPELVAKPLLPGLLLIIATMALLELHVTTEVTSCVLPSV